MITCRSDSYEPPPAEDRVGQATWEHELQKFPERTQLWTCDGGPGMLRHEMRIIKGQMGRCKTCGWDRRHMPADRKLGTQQG